MEINKLAKARKMRKPPGTLGLKKFGPGKFWVKKFEKEKLRNLKKKSENYIRKKLIKLRKN